MDSADSASGAPAPAAAAGKQKAAGTTNDVAFAVWTFHSPPLQDAHSVRALYESVVAPVLARMMNAPPQADASALDCAFAIAEMCSPPPQAAGSGRASPTVSITAHGEGRQLLRLVLCFTNKGRMKQSLKRTLGSALRSIEDAVERETILTAVGDTLEPLSWLGVSRVISRANLTQRHSSTQVFCQVSWSRSRLAAGRTNLVDYLRERLIADKATSTSLANFQAALGMDSLAPPPRHAVGSKRPLITFLADAVPVSEQQPPSAPSAPAEPSTSAAASSTEPATSSPPAAPAEPSTSAGAPPAPPPQPAAPNSSHMLQVLQGILQWEDAPSAAAAASSAAAIMSAVANLALEHADVLATLRLLQQQEAERTQVRCPAKLLRSDLIFVSQVLSMV